jgi:hypothetical protein
MRRLICPWTVFPLHVRLVHSAVHLEPLHIGNSPVAARSCVHMLLHLPGLRRTLHARHLRSRWHLSRRKLGRRQYLGYLERGVSTSIPLPTLGGMPMPSIPLLMYKVAIYNPST